MTKLSVVIPRYDSEEPSGTDAVSIRRQGPRIPFAAPMVGGHSCPGTYGVTTLYAATFVQIKLMRHTSNRGSAAACRAGSKWAPFGYGITSITYSGGTCRTLMGDKLVLESRGACRDGSGRCNGVGSIDIESPESGWAFRLARERAEKG
jgi:hypothetical protein